MKEIATKILFWIATISVAVWIIWGSYSFAKRPSYGWWYESMVRQTVAEMVKPEALP